MDFYVAVSKIVDDSFSYFFPENDFKISKNDFPNIPSAFNSRLID